MFVKFEFLHLFHSVMFSEIKVVLIFLFTLFSEIKCWDFFLKLDVF
jgi:hypothetical protein